MYYTVQVMETLCRTESVFAESEEEAIEIVSKMYDNEEIVLSADDFTNVEIFVEG